MPKRSSGLDPSERGLSTASFITGTDIFEYELISTKKVFPELAKFEIEEYGEKISLDVANEEPEKVGQGDLIHVFTAES